MFEIHLDASIVIVINGILLEIFKIEKLAHAHVSSNLMIPMDLNSRCLDFICAKSLIT